MLHQSDGKCGDWNGKARHLIQDLKNEIKALLPDFLNKLVCRLAEAKDFAQLEERDLRDLFQALDKALESYSG